MERNQDGGGLLTGEPKDISELLWGYGPKPGRRRAAPTSPPPSEPKDISELLWGYGPKPDRRTTGRPKACDRAEAARSTVLVFSATIGAAAWAWVPAEDVLVVIAGGAIVAAVATSLPKRERRGTQPPQEASTASSAVSPVAPWTWYQPSTAASDDGPVVVAADDERTLWRVGGQYIFQHGGAWVPATAVAARQFLATSQ